MATHTHKHIRIHISQHAPRTMCVRHRVKIQWLKHVDRLKLNVREKKEREEDSNRTNCILLRDHTAGDAMRTRFKNRMVRWAFVRVKPFQ